MLVKRKCVMLMLPQRWLFDRAGTGVRRGLALMVV